MMRASVVITILVAAFYVKGSQAATCVGFTEIPEGSIDRNYSRIDQDGKRPLGFEKGVVPFNDPANPDGFCVTMTGVSGRMVELAFQTVPSTVLCVKDQDRILRCSESFKDCYRVTSGTPTFTFYCDRGEGCSESDVSFWYRLRHSPPPEQDTEDGWCDQQQDVLYPEDLAPPPPGVIPGNGVTERRPVSSARGQHQAALTAVSAMLLIVAGFGTK